jgi:hypothetical protein
MALGIHSSGTGCGPASCVEEVSNYGYNYVNQITYHHGGAQFDRDSPANQRGILQQHMHSQWFPM